MSEDELVSASWEAPNSLRLVQYESGSLDPGLTVIFIKKESFEPNLKT